MAEPMETLAGKANSQGRILWMTDTYGDHNGVSTVLKALHKAIRHYDLPIDLMVCSSSLQNEENLVVVRPVSEFPIPLYRQQPMRIPNFRQVIRYFHEGKYSRIIVSTEGPMGMVALWLKYKYSVATGFYMHTDWMMFARETLSLETAALRRVQRVLRSYYRRFDYLFVLNTEHREWLTSGAMGFKPDQVFLTAHWPDPAFAETPAGRVSVVHGALTTDWNKPVVLYAGRISKEKGVMELPGILQMIQSVIPEVQLVVAGTGPALEALKRELPQACFTGWVDHALLQSLYASADILLLPSRFDTFSCVVLEALHCGCPVIAYNSKGPKDIIRNSVDGYLVETGEEMAGMAIRFFLDPEKQTQMKNQARQRALSYQPGTIMNQMLQDIGMPAEKCAL